MQCPSTPQAETYHALPVPHSTALDVGTTRKRLSLRKPLNDCSNVQSRTSQATTTPYSETSPSKEASRHDSPAHISNSLTERIALDNVFRDIDPNSRQRNSTAALQFHDAARKLRLSSFPNVPNRESTIDMDSARLWIQATTALSVMEDSPKLLKRTGTSKHLSSLGKHQERDITSARKEKIYKGEELDDDVCSPLPIRNLQSFPPPSSTIKVWTPSRQRTVQAVPQPRNFSRPRHARQPQPLRYSRLQLMSDGSTSTSTHPVAAKRNDASVSTTDANEDVINPASFANVASEEHTNMTAVSPEPQVQNHVEGRDPLSTMPEGASDSASVTSAPSQHSVPHSTRESFDSAVTECLGDTRLQLKNWEIWTIRIVFSAFVLTVNIALGLAYLGADKHPYLLAILVFMKSKDILSTLADILGLAHDVCHRLIWPPKNVKRKWILSLVCAYAETEEQIMKTVLSIAQGNIHPHKQALCIILDGKPRDILSKMGFIKTTTQLPYRTWKGERGELIINAGTIEGVPTILLEKVKNAGKKDSLILGHDLFNFPREDMPHSTRMLRKEIWNTILPSFVSRNDLPAFDYIFCTDADSTIHADALRKLADALSRQSNAIAGCGILFAEFSDLRTEYSMWHLFQQYQYTFGQYVRRQAESMWGRVTCLPGCITMIAVRPEMGPALSEYAKPVTGHNLFLHQIQYLGTDRRLTWCMMSQNKHLRTILVPEARSETVVPSSLSHYLSQRRRWASNAYFNDFWLALGPQQRLITRLFAMVDLVRITLVFYRVFNTAYFMHGLIRHFYLIKIVPTLIVTKTPALWYLTLVLIKEPFLRRRVHKLFLGMCINQIISPLLSVMVFANVLVHIGSHAWGKTGVSTQGPAPGTVAAVQQDQSPGKTWTPHRLARSVRTAIHGITPRKLPKKVAQTPPSFTSVSKQEDGISSARTSSVGSVRRPVSTTDSEVTGTLVASTTSLEKFDESQTATPRNDRAFVSGVSQNTISTPGSLLRRTPHHARPARPMHDSLTGTSTKPSSLASSTTLHNDE